MNSKTEKNKYLLLLQANIVTKIKHGYVDTRTHILPQSQTIEESYTGFTYLMENIRYKLNLHTKLPYRIVKYRAFRSSPTIY